MEEAKSYWNNNGKYQKTYDKLHKLIPHEGEVIEPLKNKALEKLRIASNCYYDLFNNGLCNRASEFRKVFGFSGTKIIKNGWNTLELETKMDTIILNAAIEQGLIELD